MKRNLVALMICLTATTGKAQVPQGAAVNDSPTACSDWSQRMSFEQASAEYMRLAANDSSDFGCLSRSSWMAIEDLFLPQNAATYRMRLQTFDATFRNSSKNDPKSAKAFEDLKILLQLRWLSDNYESLRDYNSKKVVVGVAGATGALAALGGASLLVHNPTLLNIRKTAQPAMVRMIKHLGTVAFARAAGSAATQDGNGTPQALMALREPPLDLMRGDGSYWNYTDLHLMRDLASGLASSAAMGAVEATVAILALKYLGTAATVGGIFSASSLIGLAVSYPIGKVVTHYTEKSITNEYHRRYALETNRLATELQKSTSSDWQRYNLGAELTKSGIAWVSTQDLSLQSFIEDKLKSFSSMQICTRLRQNEIKQFNDERKVALIKREQALGRKFNPQIHANFSNEKTQERFDTFFSQSEASLRQDIKKEIEKKRERLKEVRSAIAQRLNSLVRLQKPYLASFIVQHQALLDRLDRYIQDAPIVDEQVSILRSHAKALSVGSEKWKDLDYVRSLTADQRCYL